MSKLECDVIRDLLPSYVDGICSEASKRHIEEHIAECEECDRLMRQLRDMEIVTDRLEQREIDGLKKVKRHIRRQDISGAALVLSLILSAVCYSPLVSFGRWRQTVTVYCVLLGLCLLCSAIYVYCQKPGERMHWTDWLIAGLSAAVSVGVTSLLAYCLTSFDFSTGRLPFGIATGQMGSFMGSLLDGTAVLQMCLFAALIWRLMRKRVNNGWVWNLCLTGASLTQIYVSYLRRIDTSVSTIGFSGPGSVAAVAATIGLVSIVLSLILSRKQRDM